MTAEASSTARGLIVEADQVERERGEVLRAAVAASGGDVEARAVALAMLAQDEPGWLAEARSAWHTVVRTSGVEQIFAAAAFAEALAASREWAELVTVVGSSEHDDLLAARDLDWRVVRRRELLAVGLLCSGRFSEAVAETELVAALLSREGLDFLPAPTELVTEALSLLGSAVPEQAAAAAHDVLDVLMVSIDAEEWFTASMCERLDSRPRR